VTEKVFIEIEGRQPGSGDEPIETRLQGRYGLINGSHCISYEERLSDGNISKNIIKAAADRVTVSRKNGLDTRLVFAQGKITGADYHTPYGSISMSIRTKSITVVNNPDLIEISLEYSLLSGESLISDNQLKIRITPLQA